MTAAEDTDPRDNDRRGLLGLAVLSALAGMATGLVVAVFRLALYHAENLRARLTGSVGQDLGPLPDMLVAGALIALALWLVRTFSPQSAGSGIPNVEATIEGELRPVGIRLLLVKFTGGLFAMSGGLALGREGPSVQMGSSLAHLTSRLFRVAWGDERILIASCAGAGLAAAFNAPIAGAVFVLEELVRRFETRIAVAALMASGGAIAVTRAVLGAAPDLPTEAVVQNLPTVHLSFLGLGLIAGLMAVLYSRMLIATVDRVERLSWSPVLRGMIVGSGVGLLTWALPGLTGPGDALTLRALHAIEPLEWLPWLIAFRLLFSVASYAVGTPGGIFAPLLVLGAELGLVVGLGIEAVFHLGYDPRAYAVAGMAALFSGVVRAPLTGMIIVVEMTALPQLMLPLMLASAAAMGVATAAGVPPIYTSLRDRLKI
ncbi:ClC family H(+)/Cl(-) exchange transporter [Tabrizicola sp. J26]|uniref:ClC family H(+)/Cl(-) exchange transporter n=1 Tax=Alitabrizicola rongguiensis TaxID=2909234 RepID=UPI001F16D529|nr:ClC family H(+)/Cl(-) exchange transporter [Tabrizicola rongguiensis]MCF1709676.1 ClC family H(+)/Cl(-) exchange transporter [Tabrizicola rongguiensis]